MITLSKKYYDLKLLVIDISTVKIPITQEIQKYFGVWNAKSLCHLARISCSSKPLRGSCRTPKPVL
jgi:hypothetical protein